MDAEEIELLTALGQHLIDVILEDESATNIQKIVDAGAPLWYQNDEEGLSALHAAVYKQDIEIARILIENGAVWNAVDKYGHSAGDIALSFNNNELYMLIRDAGIRSELILSLLQKNSTDLSSSLVLRTSDTTPAASIDAFLSSKLIFSKDDSGQDICLVQAGDEKVGVMMGWETEIMHQSVAALSKNHPQCDSLKILNVGFGLGIIDSIFQDLAPQPSQHFIIEPHPDVLMHMRELGWYDKKGVTVLEGKWQDCIDKEQLLSLGGFDIVYFDTFSENYGDLRSFFDYLPDLLTGPDARFSFFNGLGATDPLFYDVATHLAELHLADAGVDVQWSDVDVTEGDSDRWGKTREYFTMPIYRLPVGCMRVI